MSRFVDQFFTQITGPEDAPKLVFLHGVMGYAANWRRVARQFEDRYQVLVYDSRGHGRSSHADLISNPDAYTPEGLAEDLKGILDELGWKKVNLVGHSMGGRVVYTFAAKYPAYVEKLVIVDIGPDRSLSSASTALRVMESVPVPFASKRDAKEWFDTEFPKVFSAMPNAPALAAWLYANIMETEDGRAIWRFDEAGIRGAVASGRERERWVEIRQLQVPTLVIRGGRSKDLTRDVYERMLRENPRIEGVEIPGVGHWVHSEAFEAFTAALEAFLAKDASQY